MTRKAGFEKPLSIDIFPDITQLRKQLSKASPVGKSQLYVKGKPYIAGKLKKSWLRPSQSPIHVSRSGKSIIVKNKHPQARAVDRGTKTHKISISKKKKLRFRVSGFVRYKDSVIVKGIRGTGYIKKAINKFLALGKRGMKVRWGNKQGNWIQFKGQL